MNKIIKLQFSTLFLIYKATCLLAILCCMLFSSCQNNKEEKQKFKRLYTLYKSDDDNWTTSGKIECDSFNFITNNHVEFFVDGRKSNLKGGMIKAFTNNDYVPPK